MRYVWCTIGTSPREMREAKAVIVEAESLDEARDKVVEHVDGLMNMHRTKKAEDSHLDSYGSEWFVQELATETL